MKLFSDDMQISDAQLNTDGQQAMANVVKKMEGDELSLAWRSQLNSKLMQMDQKKQRRKISLRWLSFGSLASVGAAAAFMSMNMFGSTNSAPQSAVAARTSFATDLEKVHQESVILASVSGAPIGTQESSPLDDEYAYPDSLL